MSRESLLIPILTTYAEVPITRCKFGDKTPALWKTEIYGKSWINISSNIPEGAFARVVR